MLMLGAVLMIATGITYASTTVLVVLIVVGAVGTMNPTSGDVSVFLPMEQSLLPATAPDSERTALFARYAFVGSIFGAVGSLAAGLPDWIARHTSVGHEHDAARCVRCICNRRCRRAVHLPLAVTVDRACRERPPAAARRLATHRLPARRGVQPRCARRRVHRAVAAGAVAVPPLRPLDRGRRRAAVLDRRVLGVLGLRRRTHRQADRPDPHDGVHPPARPGAADQRGADAEPVPRRRLPRGPQPALGDGRCRCAART